MARQGFFEVEVVYALRERLTSIVVEVGHGATVGDVMGLPRVATALGRALQEVTPAIGVHGMRVSRDRILEPHDRIEIYRPLLADAKEIRRRRARRSPAR